MSAVFFQDPFGLVTFDSGFVHLAALRPRTGKSHVVHCLDAYQYRARSAERARGAAAISTSLGGFVRRQAMLPVISDFLFDDADEVVQELSLLNATHDVFLVLIDSAFAFELPKISAGWIEIVDVETGQGADHLAARVSRSRSARETWQDDVRRHGERARPRRRDDRAGPGCRSISPSANSSSNDGCGRLRREDESDT